MSKEEKISSPQSSTGILRFYDADAGGPKLDPRGVVLFVVVIVIVIKLAGVALNA